MKRMGRAWVLLIALAMCLSGCKPFTNALETDADTVWVRLPEAEEAIPEAPAGDPHEATVRNVTLYLPNADGNALVPVSRTLSFTDAENAARRVAEETLPAPAAVSFVESSMGILTVNCLCGAESEDDIQKTAMVSALVSGLASLDGIRYVNVLFSNRAENAMTLPLGTLSAAEMQPAQWREQLLNDQARLTHGEGAERLATVYCPSQRGAYIVPEVRALRFDGGNYADVLLEALTAQPETKGLMAAIALDSGFLAKEPTVVTTKDGKRVLEIDYTMDTFYALEASRVERWMFLACQVLTLTTFCPQLDAVRVRIDGTLITSVPDWNGSALRFTDGLMRRQDFSGMIGALVNVYFADADGKLVSVSCALPRVEEASLRARAALLIDGPMDDALTATVPEGLVYADVLGTAVRDGVALVNLSGEFYRLCQSMTPAEETLFVYSLVSTLAEDSRVSAVRIYVEGKCADTLAGHISLKGPLMPNEGLIKR